MSSLFNQAETAFIETVKTRANRSADEWFAADEMTDVLRLLDKLDRFANVQEKQIDALFDSMDADGGGTGLDGAPDILNPLND